MAGESGLTLLFFSQAYMLFLAQFYLSLRMGLQGFLHGLTRSGNCNQERDILKWVFCQVLPEVNEKISLLNKHQPLGTEKQRVTIRLFLAEDQSRRVE